MSEVLEVFVEELHKAQKLLSGYEQQKSYLKSEVEALERKHVKLIDENKQLDLLLESKKADFEKVKKDYVKTAENRNLELGKKENELKARIANSLKKEQVLVEQAESLKQEKALFQLELEKEKEKSAPKSDAFKKVLEKLSK